MTAILGRRDAMPTSGTASAAAGVISLVLLTLSVALGVAVTKRRTLPLRLRYPSRKFHENTSLLALGFLVVHVLLAIGGPFSRFQLLIVVVPFIAGPSRLWLGLGAIAFDLLVAVVITSALRRRIGRKAWRAVHWTSYACWPAAEAHSLGLGIWFERGRLFDVAVACAVVVLAAVAWRLVVTPGRPGPRAASAARPAGSIQTPSKPDDVPVPPENALGPGNRPG